MIKEPDVILNDSDQKKLLDIDFLNDADKRAREMVGAKKRK